MLMRALFILGLGATLASPALSQRHEHHHGPQGGGPGSRTIPVEAALRHREQLKLTEKQVTDLTALRQEAVKARQQEMIAMTELSSRFRAGELSQEEFRTQMRSRRGAAAPAAGQRSNRLDGVLDETQRAALRDLVRTDRQNMRWRAGHRDLMGGSGRPR
jgi:hypothetical protein